MGKFKPKYSNNIIWRNWLRALNVKHAVFAETKTSTKELKELSGIHGFKMNAYPMQRINKSHSSNGMISITANAECAHTHGFRTDIDNKYIMRSINNKLRTMTAGVYVPPWVEGEELRAATIDQIFRDLTSLVDSARCVGYRIIIFGDFNARIGSEVGDHATNELKDRFMAFIEGNGLKIINKKRHFGVRTCFKNGGGSIVDYVITDDHPSWNDIYSISMEVSKFRFVDSDGLYPHSDHQPIVVHIDVDLDRLRRSKSAIPIQTPSPRKIHYPRYRLRLTSDPVLLSKAASDFEAMITSDKHFQSELRKLSHFLTARRTTKRSRRSHINHLYNSFIHKLNKCLIANGCYERIPCRQRVERDEWLDDTLQNLILKYDEVLNLNESPYRSQTLLAIDHELESRRAAVKQRAHRVFIEQAVRYRDEDMESQLNRLLKDSFTTGAVIKYGNKLLFDDADIVHYATSHFHDLIGRKRPLHGDPFVEQQIERILKQSFSKDHLPQNALFTDSELQRALKHFPVTKAKGLDMISYFMLAELCKNNCFRQTLLHIINTIFVGSTYPEMLNIIKLMMLKKQDIVSEYGNFRGVSIMQNLKSIIHYMRYERVKEMLDVAVHPNQAAYRKGYSPELMVAALCTAIKQVAAREGRVYLATTDLDKAFDRASRSGTLCDLHRNGIDGRCWRLIRDDMLNSSAEVVYNGIHSQQIPIRDGNPQGGVESGPWFNIYMKPALEKCLSVTETLSYGLNYAATTFSDDNFKITATLPEMQRMLDAEAIALRDRNMGVNPGKSRVIKYTRKRDKKGTFKNEPDITINGVSIPCNITKQIITFLGFEMDFNSDDFMAHHRTARISRFKQLRSSFYFKGHLGGDMPIDIQSNLYSFVRTALIFGMKIISFRPTHYTDIDKVQRSFLTTIIGCGPKTNSMSIRMLLGYPKLSVFLMRLKLMFYYDVLMKTDGDDDNFFADNLAANYREMMPRYHANGGSVEGLKDQWRFDMTDWIRCIDQYGISPIYHDTKWLPPTKAKWRAIVNKRYREIYRSELDTFLSRDGEIFVAVFGRGHLTQTHRRKPYGGFMDEMRFLYDGDISTTKISKSIKMLINCTKCNWIHSKLLIPADGSDSKYCVFCDEPRRANAAMHLITDCVETEGRGPMQWLNCVDFRENLEFLERLQLRTDEL